jgi:hypothetical protein
MLGSNHVGERENAAQLVEKFRKQRGLSWSDVLIHQPVEDDAPPGAKEDYGQQSSQAPPPRASPDEIARAYRRQDTIWRWSMLVGLAAVGLMSFTSLSERHAQERSVTSQADRPCAEAACSPAAHRQRSAQTTVAAAATEAVPSSFAQGLTDRKIYETWHKVTPPGACSGHATPQRKEQISDCEIGRTLLAQFDQRRRADAVYRAGWNSLPPP